MAALTAVLLEARTRGRHVVALRPLYDGSEHLLTSGLLVLDVTWASARGVGDAIRDHSAATTRSSNNPAGLTHRALSEEARAVSGITEGLLRLSVGIENVEDLWEDVSRALVASRESSGEPGARQDQAMAFTG